MTAKTFATAAKIYSTYINSTRTRLLPLLFFPSLAFLASLAKN